MKRREFIVAGGIGAFAASTLAQPPAPGGPLPGAGKGGANFIPVPPETPPQQIIPLWPGHAPGGEAIEPTNPPVWPTNTRSILTPMIGVYRPANPDGTSIVCCPGGGYVGLTMPNEGSVIAKKFNADRTTVFVLAYRLPGQGWKDRAKAPLQDVQRAMRVVRSRAKEYSIDPNKVGVMGFSAGGHLAGSLAIFHAEKVYEPVDAADSLSAKPAFASLGYPVITLKAPFAHAGSRNALLGPDASEAMIASRSLELCVTEDTAPCFLVHGMDDRLVPVENSLMMLTALREKKVKCEAHIFQLGRHGFNVGMPGEPNQHWTTMFSEWMRGIVA
ncbi:MAG: alpha/beta hydrolase [Bryobacteraceae bacterium]